jgi:hypothetical protein
MAVRFLEPVRRDDGARLRQFVDQALEALDAALDVPLTVLDRHRPDGPLAAANVAAGVNRELGVYICSDTLDRNDQDLRETVVEEVGHYWLARLSPRVAASVVHQELFATWLTVRVCGSVSVAMEFDAEDRYSLGRNAGAALAGATVRSTGRAIRDDLPDHLVDMIDRLDGDGDPQQLAAQLIAEVGGP